MSRNAVATELSRQMLELQRLLRDAEQLAAASKLIDPKWFRGAQTSVMMAAGELDQKGLLVQPDQPVAARPAEKVAP